MNIIYMVKKQKQISTCYMPPLCIYAIFKTLIFHFDKNEEKGNRSFAVIFMAQIFQNGELLLRNCLCLMNIINVKKGIALQLGSV